MQEFMFALEQDHGPALAAGRPDLAALLASALTLGGAGSAVLLQRNAVRGPLSVVAQAPDSRHAVDLGAVHYARLPIPGEMRWLDDGAAEFATRLLVGLTPPTADAAQLVLMLTYSRPTAARIDERSVTAISTMLEAYLALDARYEHAQLQRRAAVAALQQNECGIIVIRADRTVLLCNAAADAILSEDDVVTLRGNTLRLSNYQDAVRFYTAIDCIVETSATPARGRRSGIVMLLARPDSARPLIAAITPTTHADAGEAAAIIYLLSPDQNIVRGLAPICAGFGLSQVETRLVTHLVCGATISEAATDMRIKASTARSYLKQIFAKTSSHRQVDLVQLFTRYLRAVRGDFEFQAG